MNTTNYPSATPQSTPPRRDSKNLIIILLAAGILGTWAYFLYDKNQGDQKIASQQTQIVALDSSKTELQKSFDAALTRLDSLTGYSNELEGKLTERNKEIAGLKGRIRTILNQKNISEQERKKAMGLIAELNTKINGLEEEVARLTQENQTLTQEKTVLTQEKESLTQNLQTTTEQKAEAERKVDIASTLNAGNIAITPINEKNGGKEKITSTAKRVDKLVISFDVDNRILESGNTEVFVAITGPDGKPIAVEALGSGKFQTRDEGEKLFTAKVPVEVEAGKRKHVEFAWKQNSPFQTGNYKIEVYHNGFKIGEAVKSLKKGGIFG